MSQTGCSTYGPGHQLSYTALIYDSVFYTLCFPELHQAFIPRKSSSFPSLVPGCGLDWLPSRSEPQTSPISLQCLRSSCGHVPSSSAARLLSLLLLSLLFLHFKHHDSLVFPLFIRPTDGSMADCGWDDPRALWTAEYVMAATKTKIDKWKKLAGDDELR